MVATSIKNRYSKTHRKKRSRAALFGRYRYVVSTQFVSLDFFSAGFLLYSSKTDIAILVSRMLDIHRKSMSITRATGLPIFSFVFFFSPRSVPVHFHCNNLILVECFQEFESNTWSVIDA